MRSPRGVKTALWGSKNRIRVFAGQYFDNETGLHYNYHRYYDPQLGRYLRADPLKISDRIIEARSYASSFSMLDGSGFENLFVYSSLMGSGVLFNSQTQDLFSYAQNNPINNFDSDGQYAQAIVVVGGGVIVGGAILHHYLHQRRPGPHRGPTPPYTDNKRNLNKYNQPPGTKYGGNGKEVPPPPPPDACVTACKRCIKGNPCEKVVVCPICILCILLGGA